MGAWERSELPVTFGPVHREKEVEERRRILSGKEMEVADCSVHVLFIMGRPWNEKKSARNSWGTFFQGHAKTMKLRLSPRCAEVVSA